MKRLTRDEVRIERLLRAARSIAVLGASVRRGHRSYAVVEYLKEEGFDVLPVREDRAEVAGLSSWARLADIPGPLDILLVLGGAPPTGRRSRRRRGRGPVCSGSRPAYRLAAPRRTQRHTAYSSSATAISRSSSGTPSRWRASRASAG